MRESIIALLQAIGVIGLILFVFVVLPTAFYKMGQQDGCVNLVERLNTFNYNMADKGIGLNAYAWCIEHKETRFKDGEQY